LAHLVEPLLLR